MTLKQDATEVPRATSRTFFISIDALPPGLREAVMSAYLSMRAVGEVEDHPALDGRAKSRLLKSLSLYLQAAAAGVQTTGRRASTSCECDCALPEVTTRIGDWVRRAPAAVAPRVCGATALWRRAEFTRSDGGRRAWKR